MQAIRPVLRRPRAALVSLHHSPRCTPPRRWAQHGSGSQFGGPHKEYFQTPGQAPLPDTSPYVQPGSDTVSSATMTQQFPHGYAPTPYANTTITPPPPQVGAGGGGPSRTVRALRSVFWAVLFSSLGVVAGTGLITWEYLQPPFPPGSAEEEELYEEIVETLDTHPLVDALRAENWIEENFYVMRKPAATEQGWNFVHEKLTGTQGITVKTFKHPVLHYTILVLFVGFGIEGWPDVVHGGIVTSMLMEGVSRHIGNYHKDYIASENKSINVDFKLPLRPGEIYSVIVPPAAIEDVPGNAEKKVLKMASLLMRMEAAPKLGSTFDSATNTETHTIEIPTPDGVDMTHATARIEVDIVPAGIFKSTEAQDGGQSEP